MRPSPTLTVCTGRRCFKNGAGALLAVLAQSHSSLPARSVGCSGVCPPDRVLVCEGPSCPGPTLQLLASDERLVAASAAEAIEACTRAPHPRRCAPVRCAMSDAVQPPGSGLAGWQRVVGAVVRWLRGKLLWLLRLLSPPKKMRGGFVLPMSSCATETCLIRGVATSSFEPQHWLLAHFGYSPSPFYATIRGGGAAGGAEGGAADGSLQAGYKQATSAGEVVWLQLGAGAPPRSEVDVSMVRRRPRPPAPTTAHRFSASHVAEPGLCASQDAARMRFLQRLYDENKVGAAKRAPSPWAGWLGGSGSGSA